MIREIMQKCPQFFETRFNLAVDDFQVISVDNRAFIVAQMIVNNYNHYVVSEFIDNALVPINNHGLRFRVIRIFKEIKGE